MGDPPKRQPFQVAGTNEWDLIWNEDFADVIKDLEMTRSPWFIQVGLTSQDKCPCRREI